MKKMTLIEMVQNIASALETDEVNSITDTTESLQIAEVIRETYFEQFNNIEIPEHQGMFQLDSLSDLDSPNYLVIPSTVSKVQWIRYKDFRNSDRMNEVQFLPIEDFMAMNFEFSSFNDNILPTVDPSSGIAYLIKSNGKPRYFTSFDDKYLAFDSFDLATESTMQGINSIAFGAMNPEFLMENAFVPVIDANLFPLLLAEAKSTCFINLKQVSSSKEEQKARRQRIRMQNDQFKARKAQDAYYNRGGNYARYR